MIALPIDAFIYIVLAVAYAIVIAPVLDSNDRPAGTFGEAWNNSMYSLAMVWLHSTVFLLAIWGGLFEGTWGMTPGKKVVGLKVVSAKDHTQSIGFMRGMAREIIRSSPSIFYCVVILSGLEGSDPFTAFFTVWFLLSVPALVLDHLWPLWDKERQALHDKIAKSHVVSKEPGILEQAGIILEQDLYSKRRRTGYLDSFPPSGGPWGSRGVHH